MLVAEKILLQLVQNKVISFNMSDMKNKTARERILLYRLGAYKNKLIHKDWLCLYNIRDCKKLIDQGINIDSSIDNEKHWASLASVSYSNYRNILEDNISVKGLSLANYDDIVRSVKSWKNIHKGKDLFIKGLGGFNIALVFKDWVIQRRNHDWISCVIPTAEEITCMGYLSGFVGKKTSKKLLEDQDLFTWFVKHQFPVSRYDEIFEAKQLGLFRPGASVTNTLRMLDDIIERNLTLDSNDNIKFEYPKWLIDVAKDSNMTIPSNGNDLKRQAVIYKNCAGSYVDRILDKNNYIIYNNSLMIEFKDRAIVQAYGPMNTKVDSSELAAIERLID